jgi:phosphoserine phosphatase
MSNIIRRTPWVFIALITAVSQQAPAADPLPSWNDGPHKQAIIDFVSKVTKDGGPDLVPVPERIATFDNDGTLWCEQPMYFQMIFAFDRIKAMAAEHPEWKNTERFKFVLDDDMQKFGATGQKGLLEIIATTHSRMTVEDFHKIVREWMHTARHPRFHRPYDQLIYQPMHELLLYLRANKFKTFIVSGGGIEFMRPWVGKAYGIPPQQVIGSSGVVRFEMQGGKPVLLKEPKVEFVDDGPGKPVGINHFIGRRPVMAFGNSDGDLEMLQWTTAGNGPRFGLIVHHTDAEREYAYDRDSKVGRLDKALDAAPSAGWTVVDMKNDWKVIFPNKSP